MIVFRLELGIKPSSQIAQRLGDGGWRIRGHVLPGRTVARDRHRHGEFMVILAPMADLGAKPVEIAPLDLLQGVGDPVQFPILRGMGADIADRAVAKGIDPFLAGAVTL